MAKQKRGSINNGKITPSENTVHYQVAQYLKIQFPTILFHTDASGELRTAAQRIRMAKINKGAKWPDLFVVHPLNGKFGLFIEIKKDIGDLYLADGVTLKNDHVKGQAKILSHLNGLGFVAKFGCGFDECKQIINDYFSANF
jgi:hypothetical protein